MNLSLRYVKVIIEFLADSGQTFEVVTDLDIISPTHWEFTYSDLDGRSYRCSVLEQDADLTGLSPIFNSEVYKLVIVLNEGGTNEII